MRRSMIIAMMLGAGLALPGCTTASQNNTAATTTAAVTTTATTAAGTTAASTTGGAAGAETTSGKTGGDDVEKADSAAYKAGTYTASSKGYGGDVTVTVTVDETKITAVSAEGPDETEGIGSKALTGLPDRILAEQVSEVDVVAGATITSNAVMDALQSALDEAKEK